MKRRCPYCGEKAFTWVDRCGITAALIGAPYFYGGPPPFAVNCYCCQKTSGRLLGVLGRRWDHRPQWWLLCLIPYLCLAIIPFVAIIRESWAVFIYGYLAVFSIKTLGNIFFIYFDKRTKAEREADARLTFAVSGKHAFVKKWNIYLLRFPKRGTNEHSPTLYAMVCGKAGTRTERTYTLRVIRTDNMELPAVGEAAWLVTDTQKVVEGTITAITPQKNL